MLQKTLVSALVLVLWTCSVGCVVAQECSTPARQVNLDQWSTRALNSPDGHWEFTIIGSHSPDRTSALYLRNNHTARRWNIGSIERNGTVFWSEDSKRLFLRDEYAADDTRIRVFDVTGPIPREIKGLNDRINRAILAHIPRDKTTLWLYFPKVCFTANDSSSIVVVADAPLISKHQSGSGTQFNLRLTVSLKTLRVSDHTR